MNKPTEEFILANGVRLWTAAQGDGVPLVLCHGGPGAYDDQGPLADMVDDIARVYRYDQRASGRSEHKPPYDIATFVDDLDALRAHWGHERWIAGGHSWGAALALLYCLTYPDRAIALLYVSGTGIDLDWKVGYHRERDARLTPDERERLRELEAQRATGDEYTLSREQLRIQQPTDLFDRKNAHLLSYDEHPVNFALNATLIADWQRLRVEQPLDERVAELRVPALIVHGAGDPRPHTSAQRLAGLLPNATFALLPGVGHYPWLERPELVRTAMREFISQQS